MFNQDKTGGEGRGGKGGGKTRAGIGEGGVL